MPCFFSNCNMPHRNLRCKLLLYSTKSHPAAYKWPRCTSAVLIIPQTINLPFSSAHTRDNTLHSATHNTPPRQNTQVEALLPGVAANNIQQGHHCPCNRCFTSSQVTCTTSVQRDTQRSNQAGVAVSTARSITSSSSFAAGCIAHHHHNVQHSHHLKAAFDLPAHTATAHNAAGSITATSKM